VVFNLCDGDDLNGVPGVDVIRRLKLLGLCYTGADERFYEVTTSKIDMKTAFEAAGVPTPTWEVLPPKVTNARSVLKRLGSPVIIKPAVSAGSMGITTKSVVDTADALRREVRQLHDGYRGWNLTGGGVLAERFIAGREFTTFITGSYHSPERSRVYPPVERVFHDSLPPTEQFLSFDRLWEIYERENPIGPDQYLWQYAAAPADLAPAICEVSWAAYAAVEGTGYGRVDLRYDQATGQLFVLEVNAQCGISEDENITSIGAILRFANRTFSQAVAEILDDALAAAPSFVPSDAA
jgi:D-alanine-D-alanine ligase